MRLDRALYTSDGSLYGFIVIDDDHAIYMPLFEATSMKDSIEGLSEVLGKPKPEFKMPKGTEIKDPYLGKPFVNACKRIRRYASEGRVRVDRTPHVANNGLNLQLFRIIESLGLDVDDFVCTYLSLLQPYSLDYFYRKDIPSGHIWVQDTGYGVSLVIKVDESSKDSPVVVSFHESNKRGALMRSPGLCPDVLCGVIVDSSLEVDSKYYVEYTVQRGFIKNSFSKKVDLFCNNVALVPLRDINSRFNSDLNTVVEGLLQSCGIVDSNGVLESYIRIDKLSFPAIGQDPFNVLCLLVDVSSEIRDINHARMVCHVALSIYSSLTDERRLEISTALGYKYGKSQNKLCRALIGNEGK